MLFESKEHKFLPDLAEPVVTHDPDRDNTPCPLDHQTVMSHIDFEGVKVDICRKHQGIWLDYGELMILYAAYLKETDGESFLKEDTRRFIFSLFMRRMPATISKEGKIGMSGFLVALNLILAPLNIIEWIMTGSVISKLFEEDEETEKNQE